MKPVQPLGRSCSAEQESAKMVLPKAKQLPTGSSPCVIVQTSLLGESGTQSG